MHAQSPVSDVFVRVDQDTCMASGDCADLAAAVFAPDTDGLAALVTPGGLVTGPIAVAPEHVDRVREAALACPACAIHVLEDARA